MLEGFDLADLWPDFEAEVSEHLKHLEEGVLALEARPDDRDLIHELFRFAHTIKGAARMMGVEDLAEVAAAAESSLREVREQRREVDRELISQILRQVDTMRLLLNAHRPGENPPSPGEPPAQSSFPSTTEEVSLLSPEPRSPVPAAAASLPSENSTIIRLQPEQVQHLTQVSTVLRIQYMHLHDIYKQLDRTALQWNRDAGLTLMKIFKAKPQGEMLPPLEEARSPLESLRARFQKAIEDMAVTLGDLEDQILRFRLVPFATLSPFLHRVVRDAAQALHKEVNLLLEGEETLIDRQLIGPLQDAFIHLLRNAVDHGIESPDVREERGKPRRGRIWVRVLPFHDRVHIEIKDDGAGVDLDKVRRIAMARGLLGEEEAARMDETRLLQMIFYPGFSTRSQVSRYSGQGVGLDAVAQTIRRLGGDVHMHSRAGEGTAITLTLPLNLALVDALIVRVGSTRVAFPISHVAAILRAGDASLYPSAQGKRILWQGMLLPLTNWDILFPQVSDYEGKHILIVSSHQRYLGVCGGTVEDGAVLALRPLPELLLGTKTVYGTSILGDGSVVCLIAADALLVRYTSNGVVSSNPQES